MTAPSSPPSASSTGGPIPISTSTRSRLNFKPWMRFPVGRPSGSSPSGNNQIGGALKAGMVPSKNGAVTSAVLVHLRVEPAHFDWRWRERPALALLAWEALARDPLARLRRIQVESIGTTINFRPAAITHRTSQHRPC